MAEEMTGNTRITLNDGKTIPILGLGVFQSGEGRECERAVDTALQAGYRHIDTAAEYHNEAAVGRAISASGIPRSEVFLTTKLWPGPEVRKVRGQVQESLDRLRIDYVDLLLIHWPIGCYREAWKELVELRREGKCRSIGVSNYSIRRFEKDFFPDTPAMPAVNQIELHPFNQQRELVSYCRGKGIALAAYSPLARGEKLADPVVKAVAKKAGKSPAQVLIRFLLQRGIVTIPKSANPTRIRENADVFDFSLDDNAMRQLEALNNDSYFALRWRPTGYY